MSAASESAAGSGLAGGASVVDALAKLEEAMKAIGGTTDVDRKRAAARLADLVKTDDEDVARFARRHLPGRAVEDDRIRELRDLVVAVARLVALVGRGPAVDDMVANLKRALMPHIDRLEKEAAEWVPGPTVVVRQIEPEAIPTTPQGADAAPVAPAMVPLQVVPDANVSFPKPSFAQVSAKSLAPAPTAQPRRPTTAEVPSAVMRAVAQTGPSWMSNSVDPPAQAQGAAHSVVPPVAHVAPPAFAQHAAGGVRGFSSSAPAERGSLGETRFAVSEEQSTASIPRNATSTGLPFAAAPSEARSVAPRPPAIHEEPAPASVRPRANLGQTLDGDAAPLSRQSLPFREAGLPPHLTQMTVETYALFFALMHVYPERQADILTQYGLRDRADKEALDRHWLSKLTEDPSLSARWRQLRDQYVAHYRATR